MDQAGPTGRTGFVEFPNKIAPASRISTNAILSVHVACTPITTVRERRRAAAAAGMRVALQ
jgi:hypothetical protein